MSNSPPSYVYKDRFEARSVRELVTPEGVDLRIRLADTGARFGAFAIDIAIMVVSLILFTIALTYALGALDIDDSEDILLVIWFLVFFFLRNFYFTYFEIRPKGATPGKMLLKLRVASRNGERLTAPAVFARNAMRELEFFLPLSFLFSGAAGISGMITLIGLLWSGLFLFLPLFNKDHLRAGDMIGGTWVIEAPKPILAKDLAAPQDRPITVDGPFKFTPKQVSTYGVHELHVLEDVMRNNDLETIIAVAKRIREKIEWERGAQETDKDFLSAYYAALRKTLETQLAFGKRRKDKFDI